MITNKEKLFSISLLWEQLPQDFIWKLFLKFAFKGKRYTELCHFFFSSTLSGNFQNPDKDLWWSYLANW